MGPIFYHNLETVNHAVRVCAILQNRLLVYIGINDFDWDNIDDSMDRDQDNIAPDLLALLVPLPDLPPVHDPDLPAPSNVDEANLAEPIPLTAPQSPMEDGE